MGHPVLANPVNNKTSCAGVIKAADQTIADKDKALELKNLAIKDCSDKNIVLQTLVDSDNKKMSSIWDNAPAMILLGIVVGSAASIYLIKR